jgi:hypothetical protein
MEAHVAGNKGAHVARFALTVSPTISSPSTEMSLCSDILALLVTAALMPRSACRSRSSFTFSSVASLVASGAVNAAVSEYQNEMMSTSSYGHKTVGDLFRMCETYTHQSLYVVKTTYPSVIEYQ